MNRATHDFAVFWEDCLHVRFLDHKGIEISNEYTRVHGARIRLVGNIAGHCLWWYGASQSWKTETGKNAFRWKDAKNKIILDKNLFYSYLEPFYLQLSVNLNKMDLTAASLLVFRDLSQWIYILIFNLLFCNILLLDHHFKEGGGILFT